MKLRTRLFLLYGGALIAALLVLIVHGVYEVYEHGSESGPAHGGDAETGEIIIVELAVGVPLMALGLWITYLLSRGSMDKLERLTKAAAGLHAGNLEITLEPARPVKDELDRLIEVFRDMAGRLRDSFAQTRDFTLNASHELKTPLAIMRGEVETEMKAAPPDPARQAWMESLLEEIDRLARVVDALTFLAKADAGQIPMKPETVDLRELVSDAAEDAQFLANPHHIRVESLLPDQPMRIMGDRHRLRQLMLNLVDNAVKYNQSGGFVRISLAKSREEVCLEIVNPGNGIPEAMAGRVFERFFRVDSSHSQTVEGSGLGLNIAQWIVQCHGGDLTLRTGPDGLTRATVRLPKKWPPALLNAPVPSEDMGLAGLAAGT